MLSVALDRMVGDLRLPRDVRVLAGANPPDRAADGWEISPPLANRFCHVDFRPSLEDWLGGMTAGWAAPPPSRAVTSDPARRAVMVAAVTGFVRTALICCTPSPALLPPPAGRGRRGGCGTCWPARWRICGTTTRPRFRR